MRKKSLYSIVFWAVFMIAVFASQKRVSALSWAPVNFNGNIYYISDSGIILTNAWAQIGDGIFYFGEDGAMVRNTVIDGFQIGDDGRAILPAPQAPAAPAATDSALLQYCQGVIGGITNPAMTPDQMLSACYSYVVHNFKYNRTYETPVGDWTGQYAAELFGNGYGNCYRFASGFAYLAKSLGLR